MCKMRNKMIIFGLCMIMGAANSVTAFAAADEMTPRAQVCGNCDRGILFEERLRKDTGECKTKECEHGHWFAEDHYHTWKVVVTVKCNNSSCGMKTWYDTTESDPPICGGKVLGAVCPK